jgi:hypothetical protein
MYDEKVAAAGSYQACPAKNQNKSWAYLHEKAIVIILLTEISLANLNPSMTPGKF